MKNVFLVVNKEKIYAYVVSMLTIVTLFFMSSMIGSEFDETESTTSNAVKNIVSDNVVNNVMENSIENYVTNNVTENNIENYATNNMTQNSIENYAVNKIGE